MFKSCSWQVFLLCLGFCQILTQASVVEIEIESVFEDLLSPLSNRSNQWISVDTDIFNITEKIDELLLPVTNTSIFKTFTDVFNFKDYSIDNTERSIWQPNFLEYVQFLTGSGVGMEIFNLRLFLLIPALFAVFSVIWVLTTWLIKCLRNPLTIVHRPDPSKCHRSVFFGFFVIFIVFILYIVLHGSSKCITLRSPPPFKFADLSRSINALNLLKDVFEDFFQFIENNSSMNITLSQMNTVAEVVQMIASEFSLENFPPPSDTVVTLLSILEDGSICDEVNFAMVQNISKEITAWYNTTGSLENVAISLCPAVLDINATAFSSALDFFKTSIYDIDTPDLGLSVIQGAISNFDSIFCTGCDSACISQRTEDIDTAFSDLTAAFSNSSEDQRFVQWCSSISTWNPAIETLSAFSEAISTVGNTVLKAVEVFDDTKISSILQNQVRTSDTVAKSVYVNVHEVLKEVTATIQDKESYVFRYLNFPFYISLNLMYWFLLLFCVLMSCLLFIGATCNNSRLKPIAMCLTHTVLLLLVVVFTSGWVLSAYSTQSCRFVYDNSHILSLVPIEWEFDLHYLNCSKNDIINNRYNFINMYGVPALEEAKPDLIDFLNRELNNLPLQLPILDVLNNSIDIFSTWIDDNLEYFGLESQYMVDDFIYNHYDAICNELFGYHAFFASITGISIITSICILIYFYIAARNFDKRKKRKLNRIKLMVSNSSANIRVFDGSSTFR
ncbi:hypothetical protein PCE1_003627 [Barthelona sp. PCE]